MIVDASITLSCKPKIGGEIHAAFKNRPECETMFWNTCFGRWLDIPNVDGGHLLLYYVFCHKIIIEPRSQVEEMVLRLGVTSCIPGRKNFVSSLTSGFVTIFLLLHMVSPFVPLPFLWSNECLGQITCYSLTDVFKQSLNEL